MVSQRDINRAIEFRNICGERGVSVAEAMSHQKLREQINEEAARRVKEKAIAEEAARRVKEEAIAEKNTTQEQIFQTPTKTEKDLMGNYVLPVVEIAKKELKSVKQGVSQKKRGRKKLAEMSLQEVVADQFKLLNDRGTLFSLDLLDHSVNGFYLIKAKTKVPETRCVLIDYIANVLYGIALGNSSSDITRTSFSKIKEVLGANLSDEDYQRIAGHLSPEHIRKHYPMNGGLLQDKEGRKFYVGGVDCWEGEGKKLARKELVDMVEIYLLEEAKNLREQINNQIKKLTKEKEDLKEGAKKESCSVRLEFIHPEQPYILLNKVGGKLKAMLDEVRSKRGSVKLVNKRNLVFQFPDIALRDKVLEEIKSYKDGGRVSKKHHNLPDMRYDIYYTVDEKIAARIYEQIEILTKKKEQSFGERLNYLGLEGPNFGSFLDLKNMVSNFRVNLEGIVLEKDMRNCNLMNSVMQAYPEIFKGIRVEQADIDKWMFDRFSKEGKQKKFDVVFLDYNGSLSESKSRFDAILRLFQNGLADKAVIGITTNLNPAFNPTVSIDSIKRDLPKELREWLDIAGYKVVNDNYDSHNRPMEYTDKKSPMMFMCYYVEKKAQNK